MATVREAYEAARAEAERNVTVDASVHALLTNLSDIIRDMASNGATAEELLALADTLRTSNDATVAAVLANTPQSPPPPAE